jgi:hypothetical protein
MGTTFFDPNPQQPCADRRRLLPRIARLDARHKAELAHLLLALDTPCRVSRFQYAASDDSLIEHGRRALSNAAWLAGAFVDGGLRGIAEVYDIGATGDVEAAFVVDRDWRRHSVVASGATLGRRVRMHDDPHGVLKKQLADAKTCQHGERAARSHA